MRLGGAAGEGGQSTVELALALPLVALSMLLVVQIGLVVRDDVLVNHAAREAARAAAVSRDPAAAARAGRAAGPLDPGRLHVEVDRPGSPERSVRVRVRYRSPTDVPLVGLLLPDLDLSATAVMADEAGSARGVGGEQRFEHGDGPGLVEGLVAVAALG